MFKRIKRIILGSMIMTFGLVLAIFITSVTFVITSFSGNADLPADCAVVFGSAVHRGREAGPGISRRVQTAVHLNQKGSVERLFLTGGFGEGNALSEARVMRNVVLKMGVDPEIITLEEGASSTWENIEFIKPLITDCDDVVGISDRYHLARIKMLAWMQSVEMDVYPADQVAPLRFEVFSVMREAAAVIFYVMLSVVP